MMRLRPDGPIACTAVRFVGPLRILFAFAGGTGHFIPLRDGIAALPDPEHAVELLAQTRAPLLAR